MGRSFDISHSAVRVRLSAGSSGDDVEWAGAASSDCKRKLTPSDLGLRVEIADIGEVNPDAVLSEDVTGSQYTALSPSADVAHDIFESSPLVTFVVGGFTVCVEADPFARSSCFIDAVAFLFSRRFGAGRSSIEA